MIELVSKELQLKFNNEVIKLRYPTVMDMKGLNADLKKEDSEIESLVSFLTKLGMPEGVADRLEIDHLNLIVKELTQAKK